MPDKFSRDRFSSAITDDEGLLYLTAPEPFGFVDLPDTRVHVVGAGDTLWTLAAKYFPQYASATMSAAALWWVIADFQPGGGIVDPTVALAPGSTVYIPSSRTLQEEILNERRREVG